MYSRTYTKDCLGLPVFIEVQKTTYLAPYCRLFLMIHIQLNWIASYHMFAWRHLFLPAHNPWGCRKCSSSCRPEVLTWRALIQHAAHWGWWYCRYYLDPHCHTFHVSIVKPLVKTIRDVRSKWFSHPGGLYRQAHNIQQQADHISLKHSHAHGMLWVKYWITCFLSISACRNTYSWCRFKAPPTGV